MLPFHLRQVRLQWESKALGASGYSRDSNSEVKEKKPCSFLWTDVHYYCQYSRPLLAASQELNKMRTVAQIRST